MENADKIFQDLGLGLGWKFFIICLKTTFIIRVERNSLLSQHSHGGASSLKKFVASSSKNLKNVKLYV